MRGFLRANFVAAVWLSIAVSVVLLIANWPHSGSSPSFLGRYSPEAGTVSFALYLGIFQLLLWHFYYRDDENEMTAVVVGCVLLLPCLEVWISDAVNGIHRNSHLFTWILLYLSLSHLAYGLHRWYGRQRSLLDRR